MSYLDRIITETIRRYVNEASKYDNSTSPINSKSVVNRNLGHPMFTDNGGHASNDQLSQPSTVDWNGINFTTNGNDIVVSDNKFMFYKMKAFGTDRIKCTKDLFKNDKELRKAIDIVNGAASRGFKSVYWRCVTSQSSESKSQKSGKMLDTFWEFSFNKTDWYFLKPNPVQELKKSSLVLKTEVKEANHRNIPKQVIYKDHDFFQYLYDMAMEELKKEYDAAKTLRVYKPSIDDYVSLSFDDWIKYNGGDNFVRSYVNKYREALMDEVPLNKTLGIEKQ